MRYVVIGSSAAGIAALETLRSLGGPKAKISLVTRDPGEPYSRCLLPDLIAGHKTENSLRIRPSGIYHKLGVEVFSGLAAVELKPREKRIVLEDGRELAYDYLLVATGASPVGLGVPNEEAQGVFTLRNLDDAQKILALTPGIKRAIVAGGGLVGLKAAYALKKAGVPQVTVLITSSRLLSRQLDNEAASLVEAELSQLGIEFIYNCQVTSFATDSYGHLKGVVLKDGRELPADLAVIGKGVRPNTELVEKAGGRVERGIAVDSYLKTSLENVYAAGDCIQVTDRLTGEKVNSALWALASEQGRYAAANMLGILRPYPLPLTRLNSVRFGTLGVISVGQVGGPEVLSKYDPLNLSYRRLVFEGDWLVGFILAGKVEGAGIYTALIKSGRPAWSLRHQLLEGQVGGLVLNGRPVERLRAAALL